MPLLSVAEYGGNFFSTLVDEFVETYVRRKTRGWSETDRLLKREFVNLWAPGLSRSISRQGVTKVLNAIVKRGSPSAGNHALAAVSKMFNWAIEHGHLDRSPCLGIKAPSKLKSRDRVLTDEELGPHMVGGSEDAIPIRIHHPTPNPDGPTQERGHRHAMGRDGLDESHMDNPRVPAGLRFVVPPLSDNYLSVVRATARPVLCEGDSGGVGVINLDPQGVPDNVTPLVSKRRVIVAVNSGYVAQKEGIALVSTTTGRDFSDFFADWLRENGFPQVCNYDLKRPEDLRLCRELN